MFPYLDYDYAASGAAADFSLTDYDYAASGAAADFFICLLGFGGVASGLQLETNNR
jgi:hypothetical protein